MTTKTNKRRHLPTCAEKFNAFAPCDCFDGETKTNSPTKPTAWMIPSGAGEVYWAVDTDAYIAAQSDRIAALERALAELLAAIDRRAIPSQTEGNPPAFSRLALHGQAVVAARALLGGAK